MLREYAVLVSHQVDAVRGRGDEGWAEVLERQWSEAGRIAEVLTRAVWGGSLHLLEHAVVSPSALVSALQAAARAASTAADLVSAGAPVLAPSTALPQVNREGSRTESSRPCGRAVRPEGRGEVGRAVHREGRSRGAGDRLGQPNPHLAATASSQHYDKSADEQ